MKFPIPLLLRDPDRLSLLTSIIHTDSESHHRLVRRSLAPGTLAVVVILPIAAFLLITGTIITVVLRRKRRRKLHGNSPTTSAIRNSLEEDIESYRRERERMGDVMVAGVSQEDLEHQLRGAASGVGSTRDSFISIASASGPNSRSASRHGIGEADRWYAPPAAPRSPRGGSRHPGGAGPNGDGNGNGRRRGRGTPGSRGPSLPGSRPVSTLRNSIQQVDEGVDGAEKSAEEESENSDTKIAPIDETDGRAEKGITVTGFYEPDVKDTMPIRKDPTYR